MQAIARVNRIFRGKPAGLVVDDIGIAADLKGASAHCSKPDQVQTGISEAVTAFLDAPDVVRSQFHGFDCSAALGGTANERLRLLAAAIEPVLAGTVRAASRARP